MRFIFCASPMNINEPDDQYESEYCIAKLIGSRTDLLDFETLVNESNSLRAVRFIRADSDDSNLAIYRGWMLSPSMYGELYDVLQGKGIHLINSPEQYKHCHYLPEWIESFKETTPASVWIEKVEFSDSLIESVMEKLKAFAGAAVILKDYVKSEKHRWSEACYIPNSSDRSQVESVTNNFLKLRGDNLEGGLVYRKFESFKPLSVHSKSGMPLTKEYRLFVLDGKIVHWIPYWEEGEYDSEPPPLQLFTELATGVESRFFTMDVAQTVDERWLVVELGDAQVAGLPENSNVESFYTNLISALDQTNRA